MNTSSIALVVAVAAGITWGLRALPFAALAPLRENALLAQLRYTMPVGIMIVLVLYTVSGVDLDRVTAITYGVGIAVTAGLQLWKRHLSVSILVGTGVHVALTAWLG
ncbi:branched-chain amino acid transporter permease [Aquihabitans daechungensis]|uniref:branched-chain amino acid transporter permease n=1 Tax=Aquihabitans daechungensis TaxID=1052257 RepID=UPI003BA0337E